MHRFINKNFQTFKEIIHNKKIFKKKKMEATRELFFLLLVFNVINFHQFAAVNDRKSLELDVHKNNGYLDYSMFNDWFPTESYSMDSYYGTGPYQYDLSNLQIETIDNDAFFNRILWSSLYLDHNNISEIPLGVFDNQEKLEILYLQNNHIKSLDKQLFVDLIKLEILNLENNQLTELDSDTFETLTSLQELYICSNSLKFLDASLIKPLKNLE